MFSNLKYSMSNAELRDSFERFRSGSPLSAGEKILSRLSPFHRICTLKPILTAKISLLQFYFSSSNLVSLHRVVMHQDFLPYSQTFLQCVEIL